MRIFNTKEKRNYNFNDIDQDFLISVGLDNKSYQPINAIKNSSIFTAINVLASDIASLPLNYYVDDVKTEDSNITHLFNIKPNDLQNAYTFKFLIIANILLNGESFVEIVRDEYGNSKGLYHIKNNNIKAVSNKDTNFHLKYEVLDEVTRQKSYYNTSDILHFFFFTTDGINGISPLSTLKDTLTTDNKSKEFLSNFFSNGTNAGSLLTVKNSEMLSKESKDTIRKEWQKANAGMNNAHKVIVLDESLSYEQLTVNTDIIELINNSKANLETIASVFKIPPHKLGFDKANVKLEELNNSYIVNTLNPYLQAITSELTFKNNDYIDKNSFYKFDLSTFKLINIETKVKVLKDELSMGLISINEARLETGREQKEEEIFDEHLMNLNHITLKSLEKYQLSKMKHNPLSSEKGGDDENE